MNSKRLQAACSTAGSHTLRAKLRGEYGPPCGAVNKRSEVGDEYRAIFVWFEAVPGHEAPRWYPSGVLALARLPAVRRESCLRSTRSVCSVFAPKT